jgi:ring-1,2-phenylacetyl-CoA epoxidase subunit PaaE
MAEGQRRLLLIGGGSGIVPLQAIARSELQGEPLSQVTLIYGASSPARAIYGAALEALAQDYGSRFGLHWVFETPGLAEGASTGRLDESGAGALLSKLALADFDQVMLCGPDPMRASVRAMLERRGVEPDRIVEESFASPRAGVMSTDPQDAVLITEIGEHHSIQIRPGQSLLDAALDAGEAIGFSCMSGACGACLVTITEGIENACLDEPNIVATAARDAGLIPACITRLTGPVVFKIGPP